MEPTTKSIAERVRSIRHGRGWSLADVEAMSGGRVRVAALGSYERCERAMTLERVIELANIFGVPLTYLVCAPEKDTTSRTGAGVMINLRRARMMAENSSVENTATIQILSVFLMWMAGRRNDWNGEVMSIRQSDLSTLALMTFKTENELLEWLTANKLLVIVPDRP
jgi:transcriptional regulator with XRE-family HTH domain